MRFHYLDFSRSLLFFLGIVLHAACLAGERDHSFQSVYDVIHSFRMEAFYLIAGFLSALALARTAPVSFLRKRTLRLGVPFLFCALVVDILANCANHLSWIDFGTEFSREYWIRGKWLEHLWFLPTLLAYTGMVVLLRSLWPGMDRWLARRRLSFTFLIVVMSLIYFGAIHLTKVVPWQGRLDMFLDVYRTEEYAVFFAFGYLLFHRRDMFEWLLNHRWLNLINVAAFWILYQTLSDWTYGKYFMQLWRPAYCLSVCGLLLFGARRVFSHENSMVRSFSDASYTIYLVHWPFMIIVNRLLNDFILAPLPALLVLVVVTSVLSFSFHIFVVKRSALFAFLFNGQLTERRPAPEPALTRAAA